jgi:CubicO group peptidase (beta-lactamase class C family)
LQPLGMTSTFLYVRAQDASRVASGYSPAIASAAVPGGRVTGIRVLGGGNSYSAPPTVTIAGGGGGGGGGGKGATATAKIKNHLVDAIDVGSEGSDHIAPATLVLNGGGSTKTAHATAIVVGGAVTAIEVLSGGAGYQQAPKVTISGGRAAGRDAKAIATIANGRVVSFALTDQGAGYVPPLAVTVAPGDPQSNVVPIWAPAGALKSTIADMTRFAAAALTEGAASPKIPVPLTEGFTIAEKPYACAAADPDLNNCKDCPNNCSTANNRSGLAWAILAADDTVSVPQIVTKNGALPGFSSQIFLILARQLAIVVLVNSASSATGPTGPLAGSPAQVLAFNIGYALR